MSKHLHTTPTIERPARAHKRLSPEALAAIECLIAGLHEIELAQTPDERAAEIRATMDEIEAELQAMLRVVN